MNDSLKTLNGIEQEINMRMTKKKSLHFLMQGLFYLALLVKDLLTGLINLN